VLDLGHDLTPKQRMMQLSEKLLQRTRELLSGKKWPPPSFNYAKGFHGFALIEPWQIAGRQEGQTNNRGKTISVAVETPLS